MTYYHASPAILRPGDLVEPGYPANFADEPMGYVYLADNPESAEFWAEFLGGESMAEHLGYWPEVFVYEVEPTGSLEPDPWCEYNDVPGCWRSEAPFKVISVHSVQKGE
jgi:rifampin ADP-ribosylating transferase